MKKCKSCKTEFEPIKAIQPYCVSCTIARAKKSVKREKNAELRAMKQERRRARAQLEEAVRSISYYKNILQKDVNKIARLIDRDCPCISGGKGTGKFSGGHRWAAGGWDNIRFNLLNIWIQSFEQNHHKSGNPTGYDRNLEMMGILELVHGLTSKYHGLKYDKAQITSAIPIAKSIIKELESSSEPTPRSVARRVELREEYNRRIGIYTK